MSEISNYEAQKKKLQGLCDEHNFTFRFFKDRYPITLVITPINDVATQMDMLGNVEETGYCSQDSSMCWYFENSELKTKVKGTFSIDKVLRTKIENILLKMISFWQQFFFRDLKGVAEQCVVLIQILRFQITGQIMVCGVHTNTPVLTGSDGWGRGTGTPRP